jgi:protein TonB
VDKVPKRLDCAHAAGLLFVLAMHGAALYLLWQFRLLPSPVYAETVLVNLITPVTLKPPEPERSRPPPPQVKPEPAKPFQAPRPVQPVVEAAVTQPTDPVAPPPPPASPSPLLAAPPAPPAPPPPKPVGPLQLGGELSLSCPERSPPRYPTLSKRLGEQGRVELRVELDENGAVVHVRVETSSGSARLDEAATAAVRTWHCSPARRDGVPVHAVALQPFNFILEGH